MLADSVPAGQIMLADLVWAGQIMIADLVLPQQIWSGKLRKSFPAKVDMYLPSSDLTIPILGHISHNLKKNWL